jgi:NTE family protein
MIAIVLSGGANYGALQAGALEVLYASGLRPDMLVGVSVGALNASWLAAHPTPEGAKQLSHIWGNSAPDYFPRLKTWQLVLRFLQGKESLLSNDQLQRFIRLWSPDSRTFGEYRDPYLYMVSVKLPENNLYVFGDHPKDRVFDGLMSSTALPPLYPPWRMDQVEYVDGGIHSDLPLQVAVQRGAKEIYALQIQRPRQNLRILSRRAFTLGRHALSAIISRNADLEIQMVRYQPEIRLHRLPLWPKQDPGFWNYQQGDQLVEDGRQAAVRFFEMGIDKNGL